MFWQNSAVIAHNKKNFTNQQFEKKKSKFMNKTQKVSKRFKKNNVGH